MNTSKIEAEAEDVEGVELSADDEDDLLRDLEALAKEAKQPDAEQGVIDLAVLAEAVARINKSTERAAVRVSQIAKRMESVPEQAAAATKKGIQSSREDMEKLVGAIGREREQVAQERMQFDKTRMRWLLGLFGITLLSLIWFVYLTAQDRAFRADHQALEQGAVFGARVVEQEGRTFVLFDEGVTVDSSICADNCLEVVK